MLIADVAIREEGTGKVTLVGIFENISSASFPCRHESLAVYAKLTDAEGSYDFRLELIHLDTAKRVADVTVPGRASSRLGTGEVVLRLRGVPLPSPGLYEFRLSANGQYVGSKTFRAEKVG
jgi:hypothetical protein